ncbi:MAG TPA: NAD(P)-dependent oxidoreductase [Gemmatimonadales bacterium]|nr:NAD(P)-dependent oxidoreductase [Gemmatimonadales bacterium]
MRVSFLGLGAIGRPMAAHLARSHELTVWNRTASRAVEFAQRHGARVAQTPQKASENADVLLTCLPNSGEVQQILEGPEGILSGIRTGALFLDCTSGEPAASVRIAAQLEAHGVDFADAPVSGGTNGAEAGTLTVMVGGSDATFERAKPILAQFAKRIEHMGPVGAGHAMKAINNALLAVGILAFGEGMVGLVKGGVQARKALDVLNASSGRSFVSEVLVPDRVMTGAWPVTFRLALLAKDVDIACRFLEEQGIKSPLLHRASELLNEARARLGEGADYMEAIRLQEQDAGAEIRG